MADWLADRFDSLWFAKFSRNPTISSSFLKRKQGTLLSYPSVFYTFSLLHDALE